ncbi:tRNA (adenosine(37)-N6)-threonylcarbamoyltransferase complex dimerization subunit type 1 TsaB [Litoreibacter roseus]|uniref:tRNA N6-adenosine(37)-N6-threonylcarbamoyltransferase complex dimerization subunit TsaB n=1 Tax=Litoreibacter roseus TaxID=2601869 RepID=A0A6N6JAU7_9RHOB|nr:tRNA (adenosine(37)-N6)-threonylcarbamoyltransferase complex dimerization subunit type 1 TsaB [Litoreibacter roseus]GFE63305.1 tRNA N6-adenosine(37)-N6-threonylcarbamoyltransferase complex dimerization subunit TsaB [Litoreibacter roseus]
MTQEPLLLSFDTAAAHCAAALLRGETVLSQFEIDMPKGQVEQLMPRLEDLLAENGTQWQDLAAIGVGIGPGNFTGIRISVSAARGLGLALGVPVVGVSRLDALRFGLVGPALACIDARQDKLYAQYDDAPPRLIAMHDLRQTFMTPGLSVVGDRTDEIAALLNAKVQSPRRPLAEALGRIALTRYQDKNLPPPTPLYIRPADAAPPKDPGPKILA